MNKKLKILLLILAAIFILIQVIPFGKPSNKPVFGNDLLETGTVPDDIAALIKNTCYDCHSQHVRLPWYAHVAPVSWLVARDVKVGREHLDFNNWGSLTKKEKLKILDELGEEVDTENMPMKIYTVMHGDARLSQTQRDMIVRWAEQMAEQVFEE